MKIFAYCKDGGVCIVHPKEGARLAFAVKALDGSELARSSVPVTVDSLLRQWPISGATAEWAETEDEFLARIKAKDVPQDATDFLQIELSDLPPRNSRKFWAIENGAVVVDSARESAAVAEANRLLAIDSNISGFNFGGKTIAELKSMNNAAFDSWWSTNVTNLSQANAVLKLLSRAILRKVL